MAKQYSYWTQKELNLILENYQTQDINWLVEQLPTHTKMSIQRKIANMKLTKPQSRKCDMSPLIEETPQAYYWIGFMMADAHFSDRAISVTYSSKDIDHIEKLKQFLNSSNTHHQVGEADCYRIKFGDVSVVKALQERFNIHTDKTHNPCNLSNIQDDLFFSLIVGYIDGDGCISAKQLKTKISYNISVVGDKVWLNNFKEIFNFIHRYIGIKPTNQKPYLCKRLTSLPQTKDIKQEFLTANFYITNTGAVHKMKEQVLKLNLPFMERKWDKIVL